MVRLHHETLRACVFPVVFTNMAPIVPLEVKDSYNCEVFPQESV